ncbi:MAG: acyltransferase family protein [Bacteroidota bacterium]
MANDRAIRRVFYFDILRAAAIFAVIVLHFSADAAGQYHKIATSDWLSAAFYNGLTRCCVPLFVLLSGALLLNPDKEVSISEVFVKRLPKLIIPLVVWSIIYETFQFTTDKGYGKFHLITALKTFYQGPLVFHFWFLYMMIGIYLIYPIINSFIRAATKSQVQYFILMWFIANCLLGVAGPVLNLNIGIELNSFIGYTGYFVLGYYLNNYTFTAPRLNSIYLLSVLAFISSVTGIILLQYFGYAGFNDVIESDFTPDIPIAIAGIFLLAKHYDRNLKLGWWHNAVSFVSKESYGIYIVHVLFVRLFFDKIYLGFGFGDGCLLWVVPVKAVIVLVLSLGLARLIRLAPFLRQTI